MLTFIQSCSVTDKIPKHTPSYTADKAVKNKLMDSQDIPMPHDTTKTIIVYNVVEQHKGSKITDETIRLFIADLFGTITTILTLKTLDNTP